VELLLRIVILNMRLELDEDSSRMICTSSTDLMILCVQIENEMRNALKSITTQLLQQLKKKVQHRHYPKDYLILSTGSE